VVTRVGEAAGFGVGAVLQASTMTAASAALVMKTFWPLMT